MPYLLGGALKVEDVNTLNDARLLTVEGILRIRDILTK